MSYLFAREYLNEAAPTNSGGNPQAYSNDAAAEGPVAGFDKKLFRGDDDLLSQDYQTPGESGLAKWRFASIYPVEKLTLGQIDSMVKASDEYTNLMDRNTQDYVKKRFSSFMEEAKESKKCPDGEYWCFTDKKCKKIPRGYHIGRSGYLVHDKKENGNGNGNGNGSHNGNGSGNGNGGNGHSSGGNGGGGNGGGNGGS